MKLAVSISMDEMSIYQQVQFLPSENRHSGYATYGFDTNGEQKHATKAIVFMVQGLSEEFKIAVSYFFVNSLLANQRAKLLMEVIDMVIDTGLSVRSVTCDGDINNFAACSYLGADFPSHEPFIVSEKAPQQKIYIMLDPSHMLKNARNLLARYTLWNSKKEIIDWSYFVDLVEYQKANGRIGKNKMTEQHIGFEKCKMSVHIAAETLSNSVCEAFKFL